MAQPGFTPIQLYHSATPAAVPVAGNLVAGELALNTADGKLYYEDSLGVVQLLANKAVSGTVSSVSVATANGLAGTVANPTTTPAITLSTSVSGLVKANGTAFSAAVAGTDYVTPAGTETLTNKRITPRVSSAASITSPLAWNSDSFSQYAATAQAVNLTISADAGTPTNGQSMIFRFKDNGTSRTLTWTTGTSKSFRAIGTVLPTSTAANKTLYVGCIFNSADDRWDVIAVVQEV